MFSWALEICNSQRVVNGSKTTKVFEGLAITLPSRVNELPVQGLPNKY